MTLKEKVAEVKPEEIDELWISGVYGCPFEYDFLGVKKECPYPGISFFVNPKACIESCYKCWNRPYIEPEVQDE